MQMGLGFLGAYLADHFNEPQLVCFGAVREVEPGDIEACAHERAEGRLIAGGRTECADDLRSAQHAFGRKPGRSASRAESRRLQKL